MNYDINKYTYRVEWSEEDESYICRCLEFPSLGTHGDTPEEALRIMKEVVKESVEWLNDDSEPVPVPYGLRKYKGNLTLRVPPQTHRLVTLRAAEEGISINQYITSLIESNINYRVINKKIDELVEISHLINDILERIQSYKIREIITTDWAQPQDFAFYTGSGISVQAVLGSRGVIPAHYVNAQYAYAEGLEQEEIVSDRSDLSERCGE